MRADVLCAVDEGEYCRKVGDSGVQFATLCAIAISSYLLRLLGEGSAGLDEMANGPGLD
jgi:hypothetical protein